MEKEIDEIFLEFETKFKNVKEDAGKYIEKELQNFIVTGFQRANIPTGPLSQSIKVQYDTSSGKVKLGMLYYGYFVNFGVLNASGSGNAKDVDAIWGVPASQGSQYKFKKQGLNNNKTGGLGIKPKTFLPTKEQVNDIVELFINEYKNLKG